MSMDTEKITSMEGKAEVGASFEKWQRVFFEHKLREQDLPFEFREVVCDCGREDCEERGKCIVLVYANTAEEALNVAHQLYRAERLSQLSLN